MIQIDLEQEIITINQDGETISHPLGSPESFSLLSSVWLRAGWDTKYVYSFTWLGRPIIQLPEDMLRIQEVIYHLKPDVIIETGVAHGGSLVFYASLCHAMGKGHIVGIDIEIRSHNRKAIEEHELFKYITLFEGSSVDEKIVSDVSNMVKPTDTVLVMLDSNHSKEHVLAELNAYADLVSVGSYIVAADGIMADLVGAPRSEPDWAWNNPQSAAKEFVASNDQFVLEEPPFAFNEGLISERVTYWPSAFIKRVQ